MSNPTEAAAHEARCALLNISVIANILETLARAGISAGGNMAAPAVMFLAEQLKAEENEVSAAVDRLDRVGREGGAA